MIQYAAWLVCWSLYWVLRVPFLALAWYLYGLLAGIEIVTRMLTEGLDYVFHLPGCTACAQRSVFAAMTWGPTLSVAVWVWRST